MASAVKIHPESSTHGACGPSQAEGSLALPPFLHNAQLSSPAHAIASSVDILSHIARFVEPDDLLSFALVSKAFRSGQVASGRPLRVALYRPLAECDSLLQFALQPGPSGDGSPCQLSVVRETRPGRGYSYTLHESYTGDADADFRNVPMGGPILRAHAHGNLSSLLKPKYVIACPGGGAGAEVPVAKLSSDALGERWTLRSMGAPIGDHDLHPKPGQLLASISYKINFFGRRGPRMMGALVAGHDQLGALGSLRPPKQDGELTDYWPGPILPGPDALSLVNKIPSWSPQIRHYTLNFSGRVTMASAKNFQLIRRPGTRPSWRGGGPDGAEVSAPEQRGVQGPGGAPGQADAGAAQDAGLVLLQFGKVGPDEFTCDFRKLSPLQAFAICISSIDRKIGCP